jgi:hypothetical protein
MIDITLYLLIGILIFIISKRFNFPGDSRASKMQKTNTPGRKQWSSKLMDM